MQRDVNAILGRRGVKELRANLQSDTHPGWMDGFIDSMIHWLNHPWRIFISFVMRMRIKMTRGNEHK